jgi:hypothetical protein
MKVEESEGNQVNKVRLMIKAVGNWKEQPNKALKLTASSALFCARHSLCYVFRQQLN